MIGAPLFLKGQLIGPHRIVRVILADGCDPRYWCRCERCGSETGKSGARLRTIKEQNPLNCGYCATNGIKATPRPFERKPVKNCRKCEGLPHRRPTDRVCDCGETFREDVVENETYGFSAIALMEEA
jgi:hypothetical protein